MALRLDDLILQKVLVLFKGLCPRRPMLDPLIQFLLLVLKLLPLPIHAIDLLIQLVNRLILQRIVRVLGIELLNKRLELLLFRFYIDRVTFKIVMLLFSQLFVELFVQIMDHII